MLTTLGLLINLAYVLNSYLAKTPNFFNHLGGNLFDHIIIILLLPLLFTIGFLSDRSRAVNENLKRVLERESFISLSLQAVFYPVITPIEGYELATRYRSILEESELGGDFYDVFPLPGGKDALIIADVSGKGLRAAMLGAFAKYIIRAYLRDTASLTETCARISSAIYRESGQDMFVTAFIGILDEQTGRMNYINAGHPGPVHVCKGETTELLRAVSMPLGIFPEQEFVEGRIVLEDGDFLILYTDGLYEFRRGEEAVPESIARQVLGLLPADADILAERLLASAESYTDALISDDIAVLTIQRKSSAEML